MRQRSRSVHGAQTRFVQQVVRCATCCALCNNLCGGRFLVYSVCVANLLGIGDEEREQNPFTPGFGKTPHVIAGREQTISSIKNGLNAGPDDPCFTTVLLGNRGLGKTVILNEIEDVAAAAGWTVFSVDASTPGLQERIDVQIEAAKESNPMVASVDMGQTKRQTKWTAGINLRPAVITRELMQQIDQAWDFRRKMETLGKIAEREGTGVLLSVDELHAADRGELRRFSADMQHITARRKLPVGFIGAGLVDLRYTILQDKKMTFIQRCEQEQTGPLEIAEAYRFYGEVLDRSGSRCAGDVIMRMAEASDGLPYKMQLIGYYAWVTSGAPDRPIGHDHADAAILYAERKMASTVYQPTWRDLSDKERAVMDALGRSGGTAKGPDLAIRTGMSNAEITRQANRLRDAGCIRIVNHETLGIGPMLSMGVIEDEIAASDMFAATSAAATAATGAAVRQRAGRCNRVMKRVNGRCILRAGHPGRCRSR